MTMDTSPEKPDKAEKPAHCRGLRPYFSRSRGACMLCRQRKKKCDESKPSCWTCTRSGRECVYPAVKTAPSNIDTTTTAATAAAATNNTGMTTTIHESGTTDVHHQPQSSESSSEFGSPTFTSAASDPGMDIERRTADTGTDADTPISSPPRRRASSSASAASSQRLRMVSAGTQTDLVLSPRSPTTRSIRSPSSPTPSMFSISVPDSPALQLFNGTSKQAAYLSAFSNGFLEHYLHVTTEILVSNTKAENPFLSYVMPLAHDDDLLMEAVLCLGGTHLCASIEDPDPAIQRATLGLYGLVLHKLREKMTANGEGMQDRREKLRVMTIVMLLCQIESLQRHHRGTIFPHLRAFRSILLSLQDDMPSSFASIEEKLQGSMLEIYSYLVLVANITPYGLDEHRTLPFDPLIFSFGEKVAGLQSSGVIFSSIEGLFSLIPSVAMLAGQRLEEPDDEMSYELMERFDELEQRILTWTPPEETAAIWDADRDSLASVYRHALLIYLKASRCGTVVGDTRVIQDIQEHVNSAIATMVSLAMSTMCAVLLWPVIMVGSCLIIKPQQSLVYEGLRFSRYKTANVLQAIELLEKLWRDPAPEAYGPYGLHYIMKKTGISICMS